MQSRCQQHIVQVLPTFTRSCIVYPDTVLRGPPSASGYRPPRDGYRPLSVTDAGQVISLDRDDNASATLSIR